MNVYPFAYVLHAHIHTPIPTFVLFTASFPLQNLRDSHIIRVQDSWKEINGGTAAGIVAASSCAGRTGIVIFQDELYNRLFKKAKVFLMFLCFVGGKSFSYGMVR